MKLWFIFLSTTHGASLHFSFHIKRKTFWLLHANACAFKTQWRERDTHTYRCSFFLSEHLPRQIWLYTFEQHSNSKTLTLLTGNERKAKEWEEKKRKRKKAPLCPEKWKIKKTGYWVTSILEKQFTSIHFFKKTKYFCGIHLNFPYVLLWIIRSNWCLYYYSIETRSSFIGNISLFQNTWSSFLKYCGFLVLSLLKAFRRLPHSSSHIYIFLDIYMLKTDRKETSCVG